METNTIEDGRYVNVVRGDIFQARQWRRLIRRPVHGHAIIETLERADVLFTKSVWHMRIAIVLQLVKVEELVQIVACLSSGHTEAVPSRALADSEAAYPGAVGLIIDDVKWSGRRKKQR
jgi:hypothetical protein